MFVLGVWLLYCFPQFTQGLKTGILTVALSCAFQFFPIDERNKKLGFPRLGSVCNGDSIIDQSVMFTHLCLMQGEKIEAWFISPSSREYFGVESSAFLSANK